MFFLLVAQCVEVNPGPMDSSSRGAAGGRGVTSRGAGRNANRGSRNSLGARTQPGNDTYAEAVRSPPVTRNSQRLTNNRGQHDIATWLNTADNVQSDRSRQPPAHGNDSIVSDAASTVFDLNIDDGSFNATSRVDTTSLLLEIRRDVKTMNCKFDTLEKSVNDLKLDNTLLRQQNAVLTEKVETLSHNVEDVQKASLEHERKTEKLEAQSRRENLKFHGIAEDRDESCEEKVRHYLSDIGVDETSISIDRAHRLPGRSTPRPIIVKFPLYKDRETVFKSFKQHRRNPDNASGAASGIRVTEDFPARVIKHRTGLYPFMKEKLDANCTAFLRYDKLVVDGVTYIYDEETRSPVSVVR
ncbi:MAG: hypothetical protein ABW185_26525 [Sedimenticola sp.]